MGGEGWGGGGGGGKRGGGVVFQLLIRDGLWAVFTPIIHDGTVIK